MVTSERVLDWGETTEKGEICNLSDDEHSACGIHLEKWILDVVLKGILGK